MTTMLSLVFIMSAAFAGESMDIESAIDEGALVVSGYVTDIACQSFAIDQDDADLWSHYQASFVVEEVLSGALDEGAVALHWMDVSWGIEGAPDSCGYWIDSLSEGWTGTLVLDPTGDGGYEYTSDYATWVDDDGTSELPSCGESEQDDFIASLQGEDAVDSGIDEHPSELPDDPDLEASDDAASGCSAVGARAGYALWLTGLLGLCRRTRSA